MNKINLTRLILFILLLIIYNIAAKDIPKIDKISYSQSDKQIHTLFNINSIAGWISWDGLSGRDPVKNNSGVFYPRGTGNVVFQDGFNWGGLVQDPDSTKPKLRVGGVWYFIGTQPGRIISPGNAQSPDEPEVRIYRIRRDWRTVSDSELRLEASELFHTDLNEVTQQQIDEIRSQYEKDWNEWPVDYGAPFYDNNQNGVYEPQLGEKPGIAQADQVIWYVTNDLNQDKVMAFSGSPSIGLEIQHTLWGYNSNRLPTNHANFRRYRIINKSGFQIDSMFVGLWSDTDIGLLLDDFSGCDTLLNMGYAYNGNPHDNVFSNFGMYPSAAGYVLLQGPLVPSPGDTGLFNFRSRVDFKNLEMTSFGYGPFYYGEPPPGGHYDYTIKLYNWLRGFLPTNNSVEPEPYVSGSGPQAGEQTKYPLSGDPVSGVGDIGGQGNNRPPSDIRILVSSGPFTMQPGDTQEVVAALIGGQGSSYYPYCIENLKLHTRSIIGQYPEFAVPPKNVRTPSINAASQNGYIVLDWGHDHDLIRQIEFPEVSANYQFEGYRLWQLPSANATMEQAIQIATLDKKTPPRYINGMVFDSSRNMYTEDPLIFGTNSGVQHHFVVDQDYLTSAPLKDGKIYHFALSAYWYNPDNVGLFPIWESDPQRITVTAHNGNPGYSAQTGDILPVVHSQGNSTGEVTPIVVNPGAVTGHNYRITFDEQQRWSMFDVDRNVYVTTDQRNLSGNLAYPVVDGILPIVTGPEDWGLADWEDQGSRWITGVNWGGKLFFGGMGTGQNFLGSTLSDSELVNIRLEFQNEAQVAQDGYASEGAVYRRDQNYAYAGTGELPIAAYDIDNRQNPRRVNISFVEDANSAPPNMLWDMGWDGQSSYPDSGGHEYIFVHKSNYNGGANYNNTNWAPGSDVALVIWPRSRYSVPYLITEFSMEVYIDRKNTPEDVFTFTAPGAPNVPNTFRLYQNFPNPFNAGTTIRYWIPQNSRVKLEIFNLLGQKVATLVDGPQEQGEYFIRWRPQDKASGVYIVRLQSERDVLARKMVLVR